MKVQSGHTGQVNFLFGEEKNNLTCPLGKGPGESSGQLELNLIISQGKQAMALGKQNTRAAWQFKLFFEPCLGTRVSKFCGKKSCENFHCKGQT